MKAKIKHEAGFESLQDLLHRFKREKNSPLSVFFRKIKVKSNIVYYKQLSLLVALSCLLMVLLLMVSI